MHQFQRDDGMRAEAAIFEQLIGGGAEQGREAAEAVDQRFRQRLGVAGFEGEKQQHFEQFVIGQIARPMLQHPRAHPAAMTAWASAGEGQIGRCRVDVGELHHLRLILDFGEPAAMQRRIALTEPTRTVGGRGLGVGDRVVLLAAQAGEHLVEQSGRFGHAGRLA